MAPVPLWIASLKVSTILLAAGTPVAASVGLNAVTLGEIMSAAVVKSYVVIPG